MSKVINSNEFKENVLKGNGVVLVDFFAEWCGPCKMVAPVLEELGNEINEKAKIYKLDIDKSGDIADTYEVMAVPTLIIFKDGHPVKKLVGFQPKEVIKAKLEQYLK